MARELTPRLSARALSRRDIARIHRGDVDTDTFASLLHQTRALTPPKTPPTGDLAPNEIGWLLATGTPMHRFVPGSMTWLRVLGCLGAFGNYWQHVLGLPPYLAVVLAAAVAPYFLGWAGLALLTKRRLQRWWRAAAPVDHLAQVPSGTCIRVTGVVSPQSTVPTLFRGQPSVLSRNRLGTADELRGIDFQLDVGGERVHVSVRDAFLFDRPQPTTEPPACGPVSYDLVPRGPSRLRSDLLSPPSWWQRLFPGRRREAAIGPGDRLEVCGILDRAPSPDGVAGPGRPTPMRLTLRADRTIPLLVRSST
jgi:hypothetical protein